MYKLCHWKFRFESTIGSSTPGVQNTIFDRFLWFLNSCCAIDTHPQGVTWN